MNFAGSLVAKHMMPFRFLSIFTLLLVMQIANNNPLMAQIKSAHVKEVHGLVMTNEGTALKDVHVFSKKRHAGMITNKQGFFHLKTYEDDTIIISHISFLSHQLYLSGFKDESISVVITLKPKIFMLPELTFHSGYIAEYLNRPKRIPIVISPPPVKPDVDVPVGSIDYGPLSYFSKEAREKRKVMKVYQEEQLSKVYYKTITSDSVRTVFMDRYGLSRKEYDKFLIFFNSRNSLLNAQSKKEIIRQMHQMFLDNWHR